MTQDTFIYEDENGFTKHVKVERDGDSDFAADAVNLEVYLPKYDDDQRRNIEQDLAYNKKMVRLYRNRANFLEIVLVMHKAEQRDWERRELERNKPLALALEKAFDSCDYGRAVDWWIEVAKAAREFIADKESSDDD